MTSKIYFTINKIAKLIWYKLGVFQVIRSEENETKIKISLVKTIQTLSQATLRNTNS